MKLGCFSLTLGLDFHNLCKHKSHDTYNRYSFDLYTKINLDNTLVICKSNLYINLSLRSITSCLHLLAIDLVLELSIEDMNSTGLNGLIAFSIVYVLPGHLLVWLFFTLLKTEYMGILVEPLVCWYASLIPEISMRLFNPYGKMVSSSCLQYFSFVRRNLPSQNSNIYNFGKVFVHDYTFCNINNIGSMSG